MLKWFPHFMNNENGSNGFPPPFAHEEGGRFAWEAAHQRVKAALIERNRRYQTNIRKAGTDKLILQFDEMPLHDPIPGNLRITAGLENVINRNTSLLVHPDDVPDLINCMKDGDREQIARMLFWECVYDLDENGSEEEDASDEQGQNETDDASEEYAWNDGNAPDFEITYEDPVPLVETEDSPALYYADIIALHPELRDLYFQILRGTV